MEEGDDEDANGMPDFSGFGGTPGMADGMPGGFGGMQQMLMQLLMSDPELAAGIQNPKMMSAFMSVMQGAVDVDITRFD